MYEQRYRLREDSNGGHAFCCGYPMGPLAARPDRLNAA